MEEDIWPMQKYLADGKVKYRTQKGAKITTDRIFF